MGIAALILGIISLILACIPCGCYISGFTAIIGLILGIVAVVKAKKSGEKSGVGIAGIVLSAIAIVVTIVAFVIYTIFGIAIMEDASTSSSSKYRSSYYTYSK